ncbi:hypothetical protein BDV11DRAFT_212465 [Aspergillus similis]
MRPKSRNDFAIAIICALSLEAEAVEALFDEHYDRLGKYYGKQRGDTNAYINGRIGKHDVVLCYMPGMGKGSAAGAASSLRLSYTGIELALIVGICGGAPSPSRNQEIFLGDVIISDSVIEYDLGRQYPGGLQRRTGVKDLLGRPNREIRALLNALRVENARSELQNQTRQYLHILQQSGARWCHPGVSDILFNAFYLHRHSHPTSSARCSCFESDSPYQICEEALGKDCDDLDCDISQAVRCRETSDANQSSIHIGAIASADTVMKSGQHRDEIVRKEKVIGFEMEGAGAWDNVPCIIIKGVCDYADSHKSKLWQAYAAATGASTAKSFLEYWMPATHEEIEFGDKHKACLAKLFITDPGEDLNKLKRRKGNRTSGTFSWFLESDKLKTWFRPIEFMGDIEQNILWLYGNPGIGKSTMAMTLVEELPKKDYFSNRDSILSFFFCESGSEHQRTVTSILRGLLYQIIQQCPPFIEQVMSKYDVQGERLFASFDALWAVLIDIGRVSKGTEIYCIVDALDECETESQDMFLQQIYQSFTKSTDTSLVTSRVHFLIVSRSYPEIGDCLSIFRCVDLASYKEITNDLHTMIEDRVQDLAKRKKYSKSLALKVSRLLEVKADGTFLWVGIACEELKRAPSKDAVKILEARPRGLYPLYQTLLSAAVTASKPNDYRLVKRLLVMVTFALRPLTIAEIAEACQLYLDEDISSRLQFTREVIDLCRLLVVVDNGYVRLLHTSVQDFLMTEMQEIRSAESNYVIACRCIELIFQNFRSDMDRSALEPTHGFLGYSVLHWPQHASLAQMEFTVQSEHDQFFQDVLGTWRTWLDGYNYLKRGSCGALETGLSTIHVAARWEIIPLLSTLLPAKLEDKDARGQSPLLIAAENTQLEVMRVLVESGARVDSSNNEHQNVLHIACKNGRFHDYSMIKLLIDKGASPYICDRDNMTPFLYAVGCRYKELAQAFLQNGYDLTIGVQRRSWPGRPIMQSTCSLSERQENGSPMNGESGLTALHFSALNACTDMTVFLLEHGADPNARSGFGGTALHVGIRCKLLGCNYDDVWENGQYAVESLREIITDYEGSEASDIRRAIDDARINIVETLLESKLVNVNVANSRGDYPQHVINFSNHYALSILDKIAGKGADMSRSNRARQTCFHLASKAGNLEVIRKFVNEGHDIMLQDASGLSPFHYAVSEGHLDILHFMSATCGHVLSRVWNTLDHLGRNPLHHHVASMLCSAEVVRLLLQLGCDVNQPDMEGNSPLGIYMDSFHLSDRTDIIWLLVLEGADPLWVNKRGQNLAHLLMHHRASHKVILDILFGIGLEPAATDLDGRTLMHHGAIHGMLTKELLEFLECRGVLDLHTQDSFSKTPLNYAEEAHRESLDDIFSEYHQRCEESYDCLKAMSHVLL